VAVAQCAARPGAVGAEPVWQVANGFPQLELSGAIAAGSSGTTEAWYVFLPYQLLLVSPLLVPVWVAGWWRPTTPLDG
jgi:hypothetical protein